jgi:hypothetical protein
MPKNRLMGAPHSEGYLTCSVPRKNGRIYGKGAACPFYRLGYFAFGKRRIQSFSLDAAVKASADAKDKEIVRFTACVAGCHR